MTENFNLKWNDFHSNVSKSFGLFRNESYLHDVTLVSDDFEQIPAHKLVLSTTSEYFRNILQQTKQNQPLICLDGVSSQDLKNVLDYVYDGAVKIHEEDLDRFLNVAHKLKLEGLLSNQDDVIDDEENAEILESEDIDAKNFETYPITSANPRARGSARSNVKNTGGSETKSIVFDNVNEVSEEEHKQRLLDNVQVNSDGTASCKICGKTFGGIPRMAKANAKTHVEIHIEGLSYSCSTCDKKFRSKNILKHHKSRNHK